MAQASSSLHESVNDLSPQLIDRHRALVSLMEELEAVDWYDQRAAACQDPELRRLLTHNRDEEKEHAAMLLEWLRRQDPALDRHLRRFLFREGPIPVDEPGSNDTPAPNARTEDESLRLGSLRAEVPQ
jgi:ferritin-like protein